LSFSRNPKSEIDPDAFYEAIEYVRVPKGYENCEAPEEDEDEE